VNAYKIEGQMEWAGVVLSPSCRKRVQNWKSYSPLFKERLLIKYKVPMKNGLVTDYVAVNWYYFLGSRRPEYVRTCFLKKWGESL